MKYEHMFGIDIIVFAELTSRVRCSTRTVVKYAVKSYNIMKIYKIGVVEKKSFYRSRYI